MGREQHFTIFIGRLIKGGGMKHGKTRKQMMGDSEKPSLEKLRKRKKLEDMVKMVVEETEVTKEEVEK